MSKAANLVGYLNSITEKWNTDYETPKSRRGMWDGWTKKELHAELNRLRASGPHKKDSKEATRMREIIFALRAKNKFGEAE
jgi:hypothetical protein